MELFGTTMNRYCTDHVLWHSARQTSGPLYREKGEAGMCIRIKALSILIVVKSGYMF
jgi:hypothetical protein